MQNISFKQTGVLHGHERHGMLLSWAAGMMLAVVLWGLYGSSLRAPFIFDDSESVTNNPSIVRSWPLWGDAAQPGPLQPPKDLPTSGRSLVNLTLAWNYHWGGTDPVGYHLFNLALHFLAALLLGLLVQRILQLDYFHGRFADVSGPLAWLIALVWAVHPLNTETVIYVTQRTELMVGLFYLATLYGSLRYWQAGSLAGRRIWLALTTLACLAGMACKEVMVTAPVLVLLLERTFLTGSVRQALRKSWPLYVGLSLGWLLLVALNYDRPRGASAGFGLDITPVSWWCTQARVLWRYFWLALWPWPLSIHYAANYLTLAAAWPWLLATTLLVIATIALLWRRQAAGYVGAWVLLILSPTLLVPIVTEVMAERRMYLPLAALATLLVAGGYALVCAIVEKNVMAGSPKSPRASVEKYASAGGSALLRTTISRRSLIVVGLAVLLLVIVSSALDIHRLGAFHDPITLWEDMVRSQPDDSVAQELLGDALFSMDRPVEAFQHLQLAVNLQPNSAKLHQKLGVALVKADRLPDAVAQLEEALRRDPNNTENYKNLATAYGQMHRSAEAISTAEKALVLAKSQGNVALAEKIEGWLRAYQSSLSDTPLKDVPNQR